MFGKYWLDLGSNPPNHAKCFRKSFLISKSIVTSQLRKIVEWLKIGKTEYLKNGI